MTRRSEDARPGSAAPRIRHYGRRRGHRLRSARRRLIEELLPCLRLPYPTARAQIDPWALFVHRVDDVWLEIGFGSGEHLVHQAVSRAEIGFIGCEPFVNGVAALLAEIDRRGLANIRIFPDDARLLLPALPEAVIGRAFLLFPDPWPKARHAKRRFVCDENLDDLARVLTDGAELRIATDDVGYLRWILAGFGRRSDFVWLARCPGDWSIRPPDWPETRYEAKALSEGRHGTYLRFRRVPRFAGRPEKA